MEESKLHQEVLDSLMSAYSLCRVIYDENGHVIDWEYIDINKKFEEYVGMGKEEIIGKTIIEIFPQTEQHWKDAVEECFKTNKEVKIENRHEDSKKDYLVHYRPFKKDLFITIFTDITEQKIKYKELFESEKRYKGLVENQMALIVRIDNDGNITLANDSYCKMYGIKEEDIIGTKYAPEIHPDDIKETSVQLKNLLKNNKSKMVQRTLSQNGWRWISWENKTICDENDKRIEIQAIGYDVTELKEKERELEKSNQDLEDFAYIASHDLQEPLRKITAFEGLLIDDIEKNNGAIGDDGKFYLKRISNAAFRMKNLIDDLLEYSRVSRSTDPFKFCDLGEIIKDIIENIFEDRIKIINPVIDIKQMPSVYCDPIQMNQLFQNLISNSLKFKDENKKLFIGISSEVSEDNKSMVLIFEDNGIGFDQKHSEEVFHSFRKLHSKDKYPGSGIGLAICKRITERHKWKIEVTSRLHVGSVFRITLPFEDGAPLNGNLQKKTDINSRR